MHDSRRQFLKAGLRAAAAGAISTALPLPAWARAVIPPSPQYNDIWDLVIGEVPLAIGDRRAPATGINGTVPGPLIRLKEGQRVALNVRNRLAEDSSIHWHGLLLPANMDGVPGVSFDGIPPGETFRYEFDIRQNGTYWYHSHSGFQEQTGVYGPLVIDPRGDDPVQYDREFIILLSDWTFEDPSRVLANLKMEGDYYNQNRLPQGALFDHWAQMRMDRNDIADVSAATYSYLLNGRDAVSNWTGLFNAGERVRLRFINGSAMSFFNVRIPGMAMTVVQSDGQNVEPVDIDEFQIGVAETYDVVVTPDEGAWTIMAESMDRSGFVRGTLTTEKELRASVPGLRDAPLLTMADMGMDHMDHGEIDQGEKSHEAMDHQSMGHGGMHANMPEMAPVVEHTHARGPGVANIVESPQSRLDHPGIGLENVPHRALRYSDLRSLEPNPDRRNPTRTIELHLTGNMHRYMWSFDGIKFSEVKGPIEFNYGERLRMVLVNDTMMSHPIHLHGMFFELVNGNGKHNPRKNTVNVKPAERLVVDLTPDAPGLWAFHCHLLYHMKAGMMRTVLVSEPGSTA